MNMSEWAKREVEIAELTGEEFNNQMAVWGGIRNANDS